jgi:hypothetical protein
MPAPIRYYRPLQANPSRPSRSMANSGSAWPTGIRSAARWSGCSIRRTAFSRGLLWLADEQATYSAGNWCCPSSSSTTWTWTSSRGRPFDYKTFNEFFWPGAQARSPAHHAGPAWMRPAQSGRPRGRAAGGRPSSGVSRRGRRGRILRERREVHPVRAARRHRPWPTSSPAASMLISRLCPVDYHRFHFPVAGHCRSEPRSSSTAASIR